MIPSEPVCWTAVPNGQLDEAIISCQDRCVEIAAVEHSVLEGLCERKRQQLLLALA